LGTSSPLSYCKTDAEAENVLALELQDNEGEQGIYAVTWQNNGQIFMLSESPVFDMASIPANGICEFWHVSWTGDIDGLLVGNNLQEVGGECFGISNGIAVVEMAANGGVISANGTTAPCVNAGETVDVITTNAAGAFGQNIAWVVTDLDLEIIDLPPSPPFAFQAPGDYLIWRLGYAGDLSGAEIGQNAGDLSGDCFDLSNPLEVNAVNCAAGIAPAAVAVGAQDDAGLTSFPSPTTGGSTVVFQTSLGGQTVLEVYDLSGRLIETLFRKETNAGDRYQIYHDAHHLPVGIYLYRLTTQAEVAIDKFVISR